MQVCAWGLCIYWRWPTFDSSPMLSAEGDSGECRLSLSASVYIIYIKYVNKTVHRCRVIRKLAVGGGTSMQR